MTPDVAIKLAVDNGSREEVTKFGTKKLSSCYCYDDDAVTIFTDNTHYLVIREKKADSQWDMMTQPMAMITSQDGFFHFHDDVVPSEFVELKNGAIEDLCPEGMTPDEYYALSTQAMGTNGLLY